LPSHLDVNKVRDEDRGQRTEDRGQRTEDRGQPAPRKPLGAWEQTICIEGCQFRTFFGIASLSQTIRARELKFGECSPPKYVSHVTGHPSLLRFFLRQNDGASQWRAWY
jgi:hypothetical protein